MSTGDATIETARAKIADLVERFRENEAAYKNPAYNETQTRREFIDPFFKALGWDVDNERGYAPAYKDVIHEDAIKVGGMTKAPDYCFRIGGQRKFFVEAKKPSVDMKNDPDPYYQLRRYAYSAKLPLSIVTDFEELAIVDCRAKPSPKEKASTGRIRYWHYEDYPDHIKELLEAFSPEGIKKGGLDRMATTAKSKRGTGEVDKEFLREIESWRELLARNIALRNPGLSQRELNETVQVTIDRIIFLRICEDRGIEEYGQLQGMQNGANVYARLCELFQKADERYNSGLFHFKVERGNPSHPDELTLGLAIDDKPLKQILKGLYYPDSPYEFSVLPIDILGQVYEQFLGKVIRLTAGHQAKVEDKPEVKKAGGVYYTPTYIVDYIVKNTVGKLLEGSTPTKAAKLRILDPACGSGSFLIGAYEYLLDWHRDWYSENDAEKWAKGKKPRLFEGKNGWQLTTAEKKRILLNNIYGVDIDPQAVEVSKLSLLLKVLEEESQETMNAQLKFFHERALPDLGNNIKCGNSLIGTDFYDGQQMGLLDEEEALRVNAFDWDGPGGFPEIMKGGGFDAVIGNPPYLAGREWTDSLRIQRPYFVKHYSCMTDQYDLYALFIQRAINLMDINGLFGFITPNTWLNNEHYLGLRKWLVNKIRIQLIGDYRDVNVFEGATVLPIVLVASREKTLYKNATTYVELFQDSESVFRLETSVAVWEQFEELIFNLSISNNDLPVLNKITKSATRLDKNAVVRFGVKVYQKGKGKPAQTGEEAKEKIFESSTRLGDEYYPYLRGKYVHSWYVDTIQAWLRYGPHLAEPRKFDLFNGPRVLVRRIVGDKLIVAPTEETLIADQLLHTVKPSIEWQDYRYIAGILGSRMMAFYFKKRFNRTEKTFPEIRVGELSALPIMTINSSDPTDTSRHDQIVELVERMLDLNKRVRVSKTSHEKDSFQRQIDATDRQIDRLVYDLYDLNDEEIKIVEEGTSK